MPRPAKKRGASNPNDGDPVTAGAGAIASALERIGRLLAAIAVKGLSQQDQVALLCGSGYGPAEIGEIIGTTGHQVSVILHQLKTASRKRQRKPELEG